MRVRVCQGIDGQHRLVLVWGLDLCWVIISDPPLCFRDPRPWDLTYNLPRDSCESSTGPDESERMGAPVVMQRHGTHTQINTHTLAPFVAYFTPHLLFFLLPNGKSRSGVCVWGGLIKAKTNRVDILEDSAEWPIPVHLLLKRCQPRLTVNLAR